MTDQEAEDIVRSLEAKLTLLRNSTSSTADILNISFDLISRIESVGTELYVWSGRMHKARASALEKQYLTNLAKKS